MPTGTTAPASVKEKLHHSVREPARTVDMVPDLNHNLLMSASKLADAVLVYDDMGDLQRSISSAAILIGWRCKHSGRWRVPLKPVVCNNNIDTKLIYWPNPEHAINRAYKLPSSEQLVHYLQSCAGYPTKETRMKEIRAGNHLSWPGPTTKKVNQHYPETDETSKGHMRQVRQGVRSTKEKLAVA